MTTEAYSQTFYTKLKTESENNVIRNGADAEPGMDLVS